MAKKAYNWRRTVALAVALCGAVSGVCAAGDPLSVKRGFADVGAGYDILQATNAGWYYGWRPDKPGGVGNFNTEFVPMIWGPWQANQFEINRILGYGDVEYVLGYNEPEREDQANTSVADAVAAWRTLSDGFTGTDVKLISPGVADTGGADGGQQWLADFMGQVNSEGLKIDGVAFHWYGVSNPNDPVGAANSFISRVDSYYNTYGLPVWITEFGIIDWGNAYTDEQMRAANATFLENVIPRLESRSYVEKYAFYQWTGETTLVEGSPLTPTNVGAEYVGAIESGEVYDFASVELGEHVAYLAGGELTHGGGAGQVKYISALSGASRLTGATDWGMSTGDWVRVQPGAVLRKAGANKVSFDTMRIDNAGVIEVDQGELVMLNGTRLVGTGEVRVGQGGALRFEGSSRGGVGRFTHKIDLKGGTLAAPVESGVVPSSGALLSGEGVVSGGLHAQAGSTVRVGGEGVSQPGWSPIDDFDSYTPGKLNAGATDGVWTGVFDGTANAQVVTLGRGNNALEYYGTGDSWRGATTSLAGSFAPEDHALADGDSGTYFFRVQRRGSQAIDGIFGLTDQESIGTDSPWQELAVTLSLFQGTGAGDTALRAYDGAGGGDVVLLSDVDANEWVNVWVVVDNASKTYRVATSSGADDGALNPATFAFGRQPASGADLDTFAGAEFRSGSNPANASVRIDDLVFLAGEDLTNPLGGGSPGLLVEPALLRVEGDFSALPGATLALDLFDPARSDKLEVTGALTAGGVLSVALDPEAPAPSAGDAFDLLDFASASGAFDELWLPTLGAGLVWDASQLYTDGLLAVAAGLAGDYNDDGLVDAADYAVWRDHVGQPAGSLPNDVDGVTIGQAQYATWAANYGAQSGALAVPEPAAALLLSTTLLGLGARRRR